MAAATLTMNHPCLMREVERVERLAHNAHHLVWSELLPRLEDATQLSPLDEFHHQVGGLAFYVEVVRLDDIRVVEPRERLRPLDKPSGLGAFRLLIQRNTLEDGLDRHQTA